jgi:formyltetrahydrofolate deformylase
MQKTAILHIQTKDKKGLVANISSFIYQNKGNIIHLDQFTDCTENNFFMRIEWELNGFQLTEEKLQSDIKKLTKKLKIKKYQLFLGDKKLNMAIFVSKYDHCLFDLLLRCRAHEIEVNIPVIISNHIDLKPIADMFGIEYCHLPIIDQDKGDQEKEVLKILSSKKVDFIVLARYMQILSTNFIKKYPEKIINVHHSFLPAFSGAKPYHQAFKKGVKIIGATSHFVTTELDAGPIIEQETIKITHKDCVEDLVIKGRDTERKVLAKAVSLFTQHRLFINKQKTIIL